MAEFYTLYLESCESANKKKNGCHFFLSEVQQRFGRRPQFVHFKLQLSSRLRIVSHLKTLHMLSANVFTVLADLREPRRCGIFSSGDQVAPKGAGEAALTDAGVPFVIYCGFEDSVLREDAAARYRRRRRHLTHAKPPRCIKPGLSSLSRFSNTSGRIWSPSQLRATRHCLRQPTESDSGGRTSVIHYENMGAYRPKR